MKALFESHPFLGPGLTAMLVYGGCYLLLAASVFLVARPTAGGGWGRAHGNAPAAFDTRRHLRRELKYSFYTLLVFGLINAMLFGLGWTKASLMYFRLDDYPRWWFWLSIPAMLVLHDTFFYWMHRAMHTRPLFRLMHRVHHQSTHPTAFAAYSFHPSEALAEGLIVAVLIFLIPTHPLAFLIFQTISTAYNVYGHCGREFYPATMASHPVGRWLNTSTAHAVHHASGRHNYGLYFSFWDRWMQTYR